MVFYRPPFVRNRLAHVGPEYTRCSLTGDGLVGSMEYMKNQFLVNKDFKFGQNGNQAEQSPTESHCKSYRKGYSGEPSNSEAYLVCDVSRLSTKLAESIHFDQPRIKCPPHRLGRYNRNRNRGPFDSELPSPANTLVPNIDPEFLIALKFAGSLRIFGNHVITAVLHRCLKMLHFFKYSLEDVLSIAAVASIQMDFVFAKVDVTDPKEKVYIAVLQMFLAHCWILDETCPIKEWHKYIFNDYCSFTCLNDAMMKLFMLQNYRLRVDETIVKWRRSELAPSQ